MPIDLLWSKDDKGLALTLLRLLWLLQSWKVDSSAYGRLFVDMHSQAMSLLLWRGRMTRSGMRQLSHCP